MTAAAASVRDRSQTRRWLIIFLAALSFALAVAGWQGWSLWRLGNAEPDATISVGEPITVGGSWYRIDQFLVGDEFANTDPEQPPVRAAPGTKIILVRLTTKIVDSSVDPKTHYCFAQLVDSDGRRWESGRSPTTYAIKQPEAVGCSGTFDQDIQPGKPLRVGFSFVVPAAAAGEVALELRLPPHDDYLIRFVR